MTHTTKKVSRRLVQAQIFSNRQNQMIVKFNKRPQIQVSVSFKWHRQN